MYDVQRIFDEDSSIDINTNAGTVKSKILRSEVGIFFAMSEPDSTPASVLWWQMPGVRRSEIVITIGTINSTNIFHHRGPAASDQSQFL